MGVNALARLPAVVDVLASLDTRPRTTLDNAVRGVREAGLVQTTKRGRGAAEMTPLDAAILLLGVYGTDQAVRAPQAASRFSGLPRMTESLLPKILARVASAKTLGEAVAALIEASRTHAAPTLEVASWLELGAPAQPAKMDGEFAAQLLLHRPHGWAELRIVWQPVVGRRPTREVLVFGRPPESPEAASFTASLGPTVFMRLHETLFPLVPVV